MQHTVGRTECIRSSVYSVYNLLLVTHKALCGLKNTVMDSGL